MATNIKPIKLYDAPGGPNPPKVEMILNELGVPYETITVLFQDLKKPEYEAINPNGRVPSIVDPNNNNLTLWESGAIVEYLIDRYDNQRLLSFPPGTPEDYHTKQWLYYQVSGQGPYYGQGVWFKRYHPEKVPSAVERYVNEAKRVTAVLDKWLAKQKEEHGTGNNGPWLVGDKVTYADISFVPWQRVAKFFKEDGYNMEEYPHVQEWFDKLASRPPIKKVIDAVIAKEQRH